MPQIIEVPGMGQVEFPDGMSDDDIAAAIKRSAPPQQPKASRLDVALGSMGGRLALGAASPVLGVGQAGAHLIDAVAGTNLGKKADEGIQAIEAGKKRGMAAFGHDPESMDWMGLAGSLLPGAGIAKLVGNALPAATGVLGRAGVAAAQGGAVSAASPTYGEDFGSQKAGQIASGTALGGISSLGLDALKGAGYVIGEAVRPITKKGRALILDLYQRKLVPEQARAPIAQALAEGGEIVANSKPTAGELMARIPESTSLASHQAILEKMSNPVATAPYFAARREAQEAARLAPIDLIAGTPDDMASAIQARKAATDPMRDAALMRANVAGEALPGLREKVTRGERDIRKSFAQLKDMPERASRRDGDALLSAVELHGVPPKPLLSQRDIVKRQLLEEQIANRIAETASAKDAIAQMKEGGMKALRPDSILKNIEGAMKDREFRASELVGKTLGHVRERIDALTSREGNIDAFDLYMVRKELGNVIARFSEETKTFDKKLTAGVLSKIQNVIDDAIEDAGGKGWREYLEEYSKRSVDIDRMQKGVQLRKALRSSLDTKERGTAFGSMVDEERDELAKKLSGEQLRSVEAVKADLARYDEYLKRVRQSTSGGQVIPGGVEPMLPNLLSRPAMLANFIMKKAGESAEDKIAREAMRRYLDDPNAIASALLRPTVQPRYEQIINAVMQRAPVVSGVAGGQVGR
jgi:hypothetical protein